MSPRLCVCTAAERQRVLLRQGFVVDRQRGSHRVLVRESDERTVVIPWHRGDLKRGTVRVILRAAGLTADELLALL